MEFRHPLMHILDLISHRVCTHDHVAYLTMPTSLNFVANRNYVIPFRMQDAAPRPSQHVAWQLRERERI